LVVVEGEQSNVLALAPQQSPVLVNDADDRDTCIQTSGLGTAQVGTLLAIVPDSTGGWHYVLRVPLDNILEELRKEHEDTKRLLKEKHEQWKDFEKQNKELKEDLQGVNNISEHRAEVCKGLRESNAELQKKNQLLEEHLGAVRQVIGNEKMNAIVAALDEEKSK
jgi:septal ring factor EnvC (AmiA/AmiB activator)